jgi:hypothetical protein
VALEGWRASSLSCPSDGVERLRRSERKRRGIRRIWVQASVELWQEKQG